MNSFINLVILLILSVFFMGCQHQGHHTDEHKGRKSAMSERSAAAKVEGLGSHKVFGAVQFKQNESQVVQVDVVLKGLKKNGTHGFHIHQFGDCSAQDGSSAGGHWNPHQQIHGGRDSKDRHLGDLGNLSADKNGEVRVIMVMTGTIQDLAGRAVVVHAQEDDLKSQPAGNSGERIGCGVIGFTNSTH